ncbi:hypothetical protein MPSEU_000374200 [Mayamaea pseudoterrestris]|nr:hypothetical protein MPSEU_000374200 [Mayamaea pseudoterrestris]
MDLIVMQSFQEMKAACCDPRNNSKDDLREQARSFVETSISTLNHDETNVSTATDKLLAVLLQTLGPAFTTSHAARICALSTLTGALQACQDNKNNNHAAAISHNLLALLGQFLTTHAGPLKSESRAEFEGDQDEELVRDTAIIALAALLRISVATTRVETLVQKISLAMAGVERRVALPQEEESTDVITENDRESGTINGLSLLPRSRRSNCFDLLQACVDGIRKSTDMQSSLTLEQEIIKFVQFSCCCLQGESDPRCLQQLLRFLRSLLAVVASLFKNSRTPFPIGDVFDAIVPYYPVQFSPPLNNPYGITKTSLQEALRSVMCCVDYDAQAKVNGTDTMLSLSLSIILEQLMPLPGDDATTMPEKLDALEDLTSLLFNEALPALPELEEAALTSISTSLMTVYNEASLTAATASYVTSCNNVIVAKRLADACRSIVAKLALDCEGNALAWEAFVGKTVRLLLNQILSSSPNCRFAIAYMANLCGCGGLKTMDICLRQGLEPLLSVMESIAATGQSSDELSTTLYGIGAFFAATKTTMDKAIGRIAVSPHPLAKYGVTVVSRLITIINTTISGTDSFQIATAAIRALESVLLASPMTAWSDTQIIDVCRCLENCTSLLVASPRPVVYTDINESYTAFLFGCARTIGSILGHGGKSGSGFGVCLHQQLLSKLVASARIPVTGGTRYDWMTLSVAVSTRMAGGALVIGSITETLCRSLVSQKYDQAAMCARALNVIFRLEGKIVVDEFHNLQSPSSTAETLQKALAGAGRVIIHSGEQFSANISSRDLPPTDDDQLAFGATLDGFSKLGLMLRPAWIDIPLNEVDKLMLQVSAALPPLKGSDLIHLAVVLPMLSAALSTLPRELRPSTENKIGRFMPDLAEIALRSEYHTETRTHATICVQALVAHHLVDTDDCPAAALANDLIMPALQRGVTHMKSKSNDKSVVPLLLDSLTILAVLCASAACRGGESFKTADHFVSFFLDMASSGKAMLTLGGERKLIVNLQSFANYSNISLNSLVLEVVSRFGSIFLNNGGEASQLWTQRLVHVSATCIQSSLKVNNGEILTSPGTVAIICYMVCASNLATLSSSTLQLAATVVAHALSPSAQSNNFAGHQLSSIKKVVLAAVLKLLCASPCLFTYSMPYMTTGLIRVYSSGTSRNPASDIACKLLTLQALESIFRIDSGAAVATKPAVLALLTSAMNHPSGVLRNAALEVRNLWCLDYYR